MRSCGYVKHSSVVHNLSALSYMQRLRWLAVYINTLRVDSWTCLAASMATFLKDEMHFDPKGHCLRNMSPEQLREVLISQVRFQLLDRPDLLPVWQRHSPSAAS